MKKLSIICLALVLAFSIVGCNGKTEKEKADALISEIIELEKDLPNMADKEKLIPQLKELIDMGDQFSEDELLELIKDEQTKTGIERAFVEMYINNDYDSYKMLELLDDESIAVETKEYIVALGEYSVEDLSDIFVKFDNAVAVAAMKRISAMDNREAYNLAKNVLNNDIPVSDEKMISAFLGVAAYLEDESASISAEEKSAIVSQIKDIFSSSSNGLLKDQAIYALARISDYDLFSSIIEDDSVDFYLKVTTIERNIDMMITRISTSNSIEEISSIITAMNLHPICEVGDALDEAISNCKFENNAELIALIEYIEINGIRGVNKHE